MKKIIISIFMISCLVSNLYSTPTINGPTGLITVPTAEALKFREVNVGIDYFMKDIEDTTKDHYFYKLNLGTFQNCELGIIGGSFLEEGVLLNVKYFALNEEDRFPLALALGIENLSSKLNSSLYMVASKKFRGGFNGHVGFNANFKSENESSRIIPNMMGGIEYFFSDLISVMVDFKGDDDFYKINLGSNYHVSDFLVFNMHFLDVGSVSNTGSSLNIGCVISKFM